MAEETFGKYLIRLRESKNITARMVCEKLDISPSYMSDIEHGKRSPFKECDKLEAIAELFQLTKSEKNKLYDLAGRDRNEVAQDIAAYIIENEAVSSALREAKRMNADKKDWERFTAHLKKKKQIER